MKRIAFISGIILFVLTSAYSQQTEQTAQKQLEHEKKADTAVSNKEVRLVKQYMSITSDQENALSEATIKVNQEKRLVFKKYWRTPSFQAEIAKAEHLQDSLFSAVLGTRNYELYKEKSIKDQEKRMQEIRAKATAIKDSSTIKQ
jgi:hypothetical protein